MKHLHDTMKHLQQVSEAFAVLSADDGQPLELLRQMQKVMDNNFWEHVGHLTRYAEQKKEQTDDDGMPPLFVPKMDVFLTPRQVMVCCEVSGLEPSSLEVSLTDRRNLLIKGRIREHPHAPYRVKQERFYGTFVRQLKLPVPVKAEGFRTAYDAGLLELQFTRRTPGEETRIKPFSTE